MDDVFFTDDASTAEPRYEAWFQAALEISRRNCERPLDE